MIGKSKQPDCRKAALAGLIFLGSDGTVAAFSVLDRAVRK